MDVAKIVSLFGIPTDTDVVEWMVETQNLSGLGSQAEIMGDQIVVLIPDDPMLFTILRQVHQAEMDGRAALLPLTKQYAKLIYGLSQYINITISDEIRDIAINSEEDDIFSILEKNHYRGIVDIATNQNLRIFIDELKTRFEVFEISLTKVKIHTQHNITEFIDINEFLTDATKMARMRRGVVVTRSAVRMVRVEAPRVIYVSSGDWDKINGGVKYLYDGIPQIIETETQWTKNIDLWRIALGILRFG
jgi:hypothetical protein